MPGPPTAVTSTEALRPWRRGSALVELIQTGATVVAFALLFLIDAPRGWAYSAVLVNVTLELAQATVARVALRRHPIGSLSDVYAARPLGPRERRIVVFNLVTYALLPAVLAATIHTGSFEDDRGILAVLVVGTVLPGFLNLYRVLRCGSWLAVSRLPQAIPDRRP
jgi:hypothetical protein